MDKYTAIAMDNEGKTYSAFHAEPKDRADELLESWINKPGYVDKNVTVIHVFKNGDYYVTYRNLKK